jgi:hypothetical protein
MENKLKFGISGGTLKQTTTELFEGAGYNFEINGDFCTVSIDAIPVYL